jgi:transposase
VAQPRSADRRARLSRWGRQIIAWHKSNPDSLRLATQPQFGPIVASALVATAGDAKRFKSGRQFSAWVGIVPQQNSTGGKERLVGLQPTGLSRGGITKTGERYLRQLPVVAATGLIHRARANPEIAPWFAGLLARMPANQDARQEGRRGARQQDGPHRLGHARQANRLPRAGSENRRPGRLTTSPNPRTRHHQATQCQGDENR